VSDPNAHPPSGGYAKIAKWLFTLISQAGTGLDIPVFFPDQINAVYSIGLKYFNVTKLHILIGIASLYNNCHFRNEANFNLLAVGFVSYQKANN